MQKILQFLKRKLFLENIEELMKFIKISVWFIDNLISVDYFFIETC